MKRLRNTALLLMLTAGSLALPAAAQQEVMPDIYDATAHSSSATAKQATPKPSAVKNANLKQATKTAAKRTQHKSGGHVMIASSNAPKSAAK